MKRGSTRGVVGLAAAILASGCGGAAPEKAPPPAAVDRPATPTPAPLLDPASAQAEAPARYRVRFETTRGPLTIEVDRSWAPRGADRFYNLVRLGFYDDVAFFRVLNGFVAQFGIHGDPAVSRAWRGSQFRDDPVKQSNRRGTLSFATAGPDTRTTQLFVNFGDNSNLDRMGFAPFGRVVEGMEVVDALYAGYGESPDQGRAEARGNEYFREAFPELDFIRKATLLEADPAAAPGGGQPES